MNAHEYREFLEKGTRETNEETALRMIELAEWTKKRARQTDDAEMLDALKDFLETDIELTDNLRLKKPEDFRDVIPNYVREALYQPILEAAPLSVRNSLKDVQLTALPIRAFNAHVIKAPNGEPIIVVDTGLLTMAQHFMETLALGTSIVEQHGIDVGYRYVMEGYRFILGYFLLQGEVSYPKPDTKLSFERLASAVFSATAIETFAICHEIGHIHLGHLENAQTKNLNFQESAASNAEFYQLSWKQEIEADLFGWNLYCEVARRTPVLSEFRVIDLPRCLYLFVLLTLVDRNLRVPDRYSTHPPALSRLEAIIQYIRSSQHDMELLDRASMILPFAKSVPDQKAFLDFFSGS